MKVNVKKFQDQEEWRSALQINVENQHDKTELSFIEGEPEDASLGRDFNDVYRIEDLVRIAYDAGKKGESLEIDHESYDSFDEL